MLDYSKAFDLINHEIVFQKLPDMRTPALLLRWIAAFLTARQQQVRIGGSQSSWLQLCGCAPQGTLVGIILFIVHINDLEFECKYSKYDDANIIRISDDPTSTAVQMTLTRLINGPVNYIIEVLIQSKILGVIISGDLKWNQHRL